MKLKKCLVVLVKKIITNLLTFLDNMNIKIFNLYLFLLIFNIVNREFVPLIDIRYVIFFLMFLLLFNSLRTIKSKKKKINNYNLFVLIIFLYIFIAVSNVAWLYNGLDVRKSEIINLIILNIFNFFNIVTIYVYQENLIANRLIKYFKISILFMLLSMLIVMFGFTLPLTEYTGLACGEAHYNMFGYNCRYSGYAIDPNYVTLILFTFIALLIK
jgi:hypothetical protein